MGPACTNRCTSTAHTSECARCHVQRARFESSAAQRWQHAGCKVQHHLCVWATTLSRSVTSRSYQKALVALLSVVGQQRPLPHLPWQVPPAAAGPLFQRSRQVSVGMRLGGGVAGGGGRRGAASNAPGVLVPSAAGVWEGVILGVPLCLLGPCCAGGQRDTAAASVPLQQQHCPAGGVHARAAARAQWQPIAHQ